MVLYRLASCSRISSLPFSLVNAIAVVHLRLLFFFCWLALFLFASFALHFSQCRAAVPSPAHSPLLPLLLLAYTLSRAGRCLHSAFVMYVRFLLICFGCPLFEAVFYSCASPYYDANYGCLFGSPTLSISDKMARQGSTAVSQKMRLQSVSSFLFRVRAWVWYSCTHEGVVCSPMSG